MCLINLESNGNLDEMFVFLEDMMDNMEVSIKLFYNQYVMKLVSEEEKKDEKLLLRLKKFAFIFWATVKSYISPISAMIVGIVAQEIIKAIT